MFTLSAIDRKHRILWQHSRDGQISQFWNRCNEPM